MSFPHCDQRILHAPNECDVCDTKPEWQQLRQDWGIAFTGHIPTKDQYGTQQLPCPADFARPPGFKGDHRRWGGNTAKKGKVVGSLGMYEITENDPNLTDPSLQVPPNQLPDKPW